MTEQEQRVEIAEGVKFGRLTAMEFVRITSSRMKVWRWKCDCGRVKDILLSSVTTGHTVSCGCFRVETTRREKTLHGNAKRKQHSPEYRTWRGILDRTTNEKLPAFPDYGGRGIIVCKEWTESFEKFLSDMGQKPSDAHSIERNNNDGNYEPGNCRWATAKEQAQNRRRRRWKKKP